MTENKGDLISREALKEHKFVGNKFVQIGGRNNGKTLESINKAYQQGWNDCIDAIIDNAPTVEEVSVIEFKEPLPLVKAQKIVKALSKRPQGDFAEILNERIEKSVCKFCQMNKHCELCEISRVFMIIALTDKEMNEGGAE